MGKNSLFEKESDENNLDVFSMRIRQGFFVVLQSLLFVGKTQKKDVFSLVFLVVMRVGSSFLT